MDGTLLDRRHRLSARTVETVKRLADIGVPFVLVSARMPDSMFFCQRELGLDTPMVCYNGALVLDGARREVLSLGIPLAVAADIKRRIALGWPRVSATVYSGNLWISDEGDSRWVREEAAITSVPPRLGDFETILGPGGEAHKVFCMGEPDEIDAIAAAMRELHPELSIHKSKDTYLEILNPDALKSKAVRFLCDGWGIDPGETAAFGDNFNDIDMIAAAGVGVAMANAPEGVRRHAKLIAPDNDNDGVAEILASLSFAPPAKRGYSSGKA